MPPKPSKQPKPSKLLRPPKLGICSRILRPIQKYTNICWFLAIVVIMFYSQRSRRVIMEASKTWDGRVKTGMERIVFSLFKNLLYERYLIVGEYPANSKEYKTFNEATFLEILKQLFEMNSNDFPYNPDDNKGYHMDSYIYKLYNLLGVDCKMFDYEPAPKYKGELYYSSVNKEFDSNISISSYNNTKPHIPGWQPYILNPNVGVYKDDGHAPFILIITRTPFLTPFANNKIVNDDVTKELSSMKQKITYNGYEYHLDSVYLINANRTGFIDHAIVGMTCKNKKYIFNGEPYMGRSNFPCVLIPHNWNIQSDRDFYLSDNDCILHSVPKTKDENRYNFSEGKRRFIYVRKNASRDTSHSNEYDVEKYRQEQREAVILDKQREATRLEEARLRFQSDVEKIHQEQREAARLEEEMKVRKPNISRYARLMNPLSRLIPSLFPNREQIETARLRQEEEQREKEAISRERKEATVRLEKEKKARLRQEEEQREKEAISRERKEAISRERKEAISRERKEAISRERKEAISRERKEASVRLEKEKEAKLRYDEEHKRKKADSQDKEEAILRERKEAILRLRQEEEQMALIEKERKKIEAVRLSDDLAVIMAKLKLDDRGKPKRKRKSSSNGNGSSPKLIPQPPKKQDRRSSPNKAKAKTITKRKRYIRKTMI